MEYTMDRSDSHGVHYRAEVIAMEYTTEQK